MLPVAIVVISLALVFYSVGVWAERFQRTLAWWHAAFFAAGLAADTTGTILMTIIAQQRRQEGVPAGAFDSLMAVTGTIAIALMAIHLVWAVIVLVRDRASEKQAFHRLSVIVWAVWLLPYLAGAAAVMANPR